MNEKKKLTLLAVFGILSMSVGFSALNTELTVSGEANVRVEQDVRVVSNMLSAATGGAYTKYNPNFSISTVSATPVMPGAGATLDFDFVVQNSTEDLYMILENTETEGFSGSAAVTGCEPGALLQPNSTTNCQLALSAADAYDGRMIMNFRWVKYSITAPTIQGGSDNWTASVANVSIAAAGTASDGVKHYEYYTSTSSSTPAATVQATGTTSNVVQMATNGEYYIWYRTVSTYGQKSAWSNRRMMRRDNVTPSFLIRNGTYDRNNTGSVWRTATWGPSGSGSISCINTSYNNRTVTTIATIRSLGKNTISCTATSPTGVKRTVSGVFAISGRFLPPELKYTDGSTITSSNHIAVPYGGKQFGPYYRVNAGRYKISYLFAQEFTGFNSSNQGKTYTFTVQEYNVAQYSVSGLASSVNNTVVSYNTNITRAAGTSGIEFVFVNISAKSALYVVSVQVDPI